MEDIKTEAVVEEHPIEKTEVVVEEQPIEKTEVVVEEQPIEKTEAVVEEQPIKTLAEQAQERLDAEKDAKEAAIKKDAKAKAESYALTCKRYQKFTEDELKAMWGDKWYYVIVALQEGGFYYVRTSKVNYRFTLFGIGFGEEVTYFHEIYVKKPQN